MPNRKDAAVPRFFFDIHDGSNSTQDEFGDDHANFAEARDHAQAILADFMRDELPDGEERVFICEVRDVARNVVYRGRLRFHGEPMPVPAEAR